MVGRKKTVPTKRSGSGKSNVKTSVTPVKEKDRRRTGSATGRTTTSSSGEENEAQTPKRKYRARPGTKVLREIRYFQSSTHMLIRKASFARLIREVASQYTGGDMRFQLAAIMALHEASESYLVRMFESANLAAIHGRRVTVMPKDMQLVLKLRDSL